MSGCNKLCPEEIRIELDDSFLWGEQTEVLVYCLVVAMTFICFAVKGLFSYWHYMLLKKQNQFLQRAKDIETRNAIYRVCDVNITQDSTKLTLRPCALALPGVSRL